MVHHPGIGIVAQFGMLLLVLYLPISTLLFLELQRASFGNMATAQTGQIYANSKIRKLQSGKCPRFLAFVE